MAGPIVYGVLTGDIVKSTALAPGVLESVREELLASIEGMGGWKKGGIVGQGEFYRGDGWQLATAYPASALRLALYLRATLLARGNADSRISIGIGPAAFIDENRISLSTGPAFEVSGRGLDQMPGHSRLHIGLSDDMHLLAPWLAVVGNLCDAIVSGWTQRQAEMVVLAIVPDEPTHDWIGERLKPPVSKQAVAKALGLARWHALREAIHLFEATDWRALTAGEDDNL